MKDWDIYYIVEIEGIGMVSVNSSMGDALLSIKGMLQYCPWAKLSIESKGLDSEEFKYLATIAQSNCDYVKTIINR